MRNMRMLNKKLYKKISLFLISFLLFPLIRLAQENCI